MTGKDTWPVACSTADPSLISEVKVGSRRVIIFGLEGMLDGVAALGITDEPALRAELLRQAGERGRIPWGLEEAATDALLILYRRRHSRNGFVGEKISRCDDRREK
ncbi:hypothetical protein [Methanofollis ethanolicus]|uniref:hypothetical protein n=1 Tax=Methanofollis ethanolicus TaxID=488124 RepID=UPI00082D0CED|nr:hypothetical protein [Methanofollis ethanolicus]